MIKPGVLAKMEIGNEEEKDEAATQKVNGGAGSHPRLNLDAPILAKLWYLEFKNTENVFS